MNPSSPPGGPSLSGALFAAECCLIRKKTASDALSLNVVILAGRSTLADLHQALEDYLHTLLGLLKDGSQLHHKVQFVWVNQEDDAEETAIFSAWYEVLSVLHLLAMLTMSQTNLLLLPRTSADGYQPKVSEESRRASIDILLKGAGYLDCAIRHVLPQFPADLRRNLPVDIAEGVLQRLDC